MIDNLPSRASSRALWRLALSCFLALPPLCIAQIPSPSTNAAPPVAAAPASPSTDAIYASEPFVIERSDSVHDMRADGTGYRELTLVAHLQSDAAVKKFGLISIPYASSSEHVELNYARARHPDGTVVETQTSDALDMPTPVTQQAPIYSDQKQLQLPIRGLRLGDRLELKYCIVRTKAEAPDEFWGRESFSGTDVVLEQSVELRVPAGKYVNVWSPALKPTESDIVATSDAPAEHIYRWSHAQLKPTVGKDAEAEAAARKKILWTPEQELDLEQGRLPTVVWSTYKSWEEIGAWYRSLESDRIVPDASVKAKADEIAAGKTTDEDKARALYEYVSTKIRYIGVAFGIGRFQPHSAADILVNQYGDCKDKHTLLAAMLSAEGISSDAVLIGAGIRFNDAVPSPAAFNHLITHLVLNGKPVWLDTTAEVAPFGMLVLPTRDKQSLVIPTNPSLAPAIVRTPAAPLVASAVTLDATGSLDATGVSTSRVALTFRGDEELVIRAAFRQLSPDRYDQVVQAASKGIGFTGTASNSDVTPPTGTGDTFKFAYDYKREKAGDWEHLKTVPQVLPVALPRVTDIDPPVHAIQLGQPHTEDSTSAMKLPDGWHVVLPVPVHVQCAYGTYDMTYRFENGTVYAERHLAILAKKVPVSDWKTYQKWVDAVNPGREPYIQLVTADSKAAEPRTKQIEDALNSSDPILKNGLAFALVGKKEHLDDAQTLAEQAVQIEEKNTAKSVSMANKTASFDQMQGLGADWETLGLVLTHQHQLDKAESYMHAAWELKPRNADINLFMGAIYEAEHKNDDAVTFYRMALSASNSPQIHTFIQTHFTELGATAIDPLPTDVVVPLPSLMLQLSSSDPRPVVDILFTRENLPAVAMVKGDPALAKSLADAIVSAHVNPFPDSGPEKILRRAVLACTQDGSAPCALHLLGSQVAMEQSASGK